MSADIRRAAERFRCPHCRKRYPPGSLVVFYPDPEWIWGCRTCGQMWVDMLSSAGATASGLSINVDLGPSVSDQPEGRSICAEADRQPLAYDAAPDLDDPPD